ncbi:phage protease [Variovorax gossypii]
MKKSALALLVAALSVQASEDVHLLPAGEFVGRDGRPGKNLTWKLSDEQGRALAAQMNKRHERVKFQLDYEHQSMLSEENGKPAPASGWATTFEWRAGDGLYATNVQWTATAKQMIEALEYQYISPVILYDEKTGVVTGVINAALVGIPALDLNPVAQQRVARMNASFASSPTNPEQSPMNPILKALLAALGLAETATEQEATTAVATLKAQAESVGGLNTQIAALKAQTPDPTKWAPVETVNTLNTEIAALRSSVATREVDELIERARAEGKVVAAVEPVWRELGKSNLAQLKALVDSTPANPALAGKTQTGGKAPGKEGGNEEGSAAELAICKNMGMTLAEYRAGADA